MRAVPRSTLFVSKHRGRGIVPSAVLVGPLAEGRGVGAKGGNPARHSGCGTRVRATGAYIARRKRGRCGLGAPCRAHAAFVSPSDDVKMLSAVRAVAAAKLCATSATVARASMVAARALPQRCVSTGAVVSVRAAPRASASALLRVLRNVAAAAATAGGLCLTLHLANTTDGEMILFSGKANPELATEIASLLGVSLGNITVDRFADGEVNVQVHDNVRGKDVYIIQPTCSPVNEYLMELLLMVSTMRRASAERITAVIPYYGYARQDRKMAARVPISAADVARLLDPPMGVDRVVAVDLHCGQIQGFFGPRVPVDNLAAGIVGVQYFANHGLVNPVVISPDAGGVYRAKQFREGLNMQNATLDAGLAMIIKQRPKAGQIERMDLVGSVENADCVIVDDMIDTAGTLCTAAQHLKANGARRVYAFASHGLFSGPASDRIARSVLEEVVVTNTIPLRAAAKTNEKIVQLSVAPLVAEAIKRVHFRQSISDLFKTKKDGSSE